MQTEEKNTSEDIEQSDNGAIRVDRSADPFAGLMTGLMNTLLNPKKNCQTEGKCDETSESNRPKKGRRSLRSRIETMESDDESEESLCDSDESEDSQTISESTLEKLIEAHLNLTKAVLHIIRGESD